MNNWLDYGWLLLWHILLLQSNNLRLVGSNVTLRNNVFCYESWRIKGQWWLLQSSLHKGLLTFWLDWSAFESRWERGIVCLLLILVSLIFEGGCFKLFLVVTHLFEEFLELLWGDYVFIFLLIVLDLGSILAEISMGNETLWEDKVARTLMGLIKVGGGWVGTMSVDLVVADVEASVFLLPSLSLSSSSLLELPWIGFSELWYWFADVGLDWFSPFYCCCWCC